MTGSTIIRRLEMNKRRFIVMEITALFSWTPNT